LTDPWLDQLRQLHDADKAERQSKTEVQEQAEQQEKERQDLALALLQTSRAHELLRRLQKALLDGQGTLDVYEKSDNYDRAIVLAWQGPISAARRPTPKDSEDYRYILVGAREGRLLVNGDEVSPPTPNALKAALLAASKNPATQKHTPEKKKP
jgi:hypothetical protein